MALAYQVQFLESFPEPLDLVSVEVRGHPDLVARLVAHLDGDSIFRNRKKQVDEDFTWQKNRPEKVFLTSESVFKLTSSFLSETNPKFAKTKSSFSRQRLFLPTTTIFCVCSFDSDNTRQEWANLLIFSWVTFLSSRRCGGKFFENFFRLLLLLGSKTWNKNEDRSESEKEEEKHKTLSNVRTAIISS